MEKNEFLLCSEVIYRINVCRTVEELRGGLLAQLKLIIPYACASIIPIQEDPDSHEIRHGTPFCWPEAFQTVEQRWIEGIDQAYTAWLSHAREPVLLRDSEVLGEEERFSIPTYRFYERNGYRFYDCLQMNLVYSEQVLGRLSLYRTRREGSRRRRPSTSGFWPTTSTWPTPAAWSRRRGTEGGPPCRNCSRPTT